MRCGPSCTCSRSPTSSISRSASTSPTWRAARRYSDLPLRRAGAWGVVGWSFGEAALFYALVNIMFSIADLLTRGFEVFGTDFVRTGAFDRVLLRPRAAALQLAGHEVRLSRLGRLLQAFAVLILASGLVPITWDAAAVATAVWAVAGGVRVFVGILILQATLAL